MQTRVKADTEAGIAESGMVIERRFTTAGDDPFNAFDWAEQDVEIRNPDGSMADAIKGVKLPFGFAGVPGTVCAQKYLRKAGVPKYLKKVAEEGVPVWLQRSVPDHERLQTLEANERMGGETDGRDLFRRLAGTWTYWGWKYGYFANEVDARAYFDEMCYLIASQRSAPNSPQWFNTGLHWAYGIEGPAQGHSFIDPETGKLEYSTNAYEHPQPHACFIQSVSDSLVGGSESIMGLWNREALLFKYGSGTGSNFSRIRGAGEPLSGGGSSSGLLSFLKIGDRAAGAIKSGGTTRRAAKMVTLDMDHPDIEAYIDWKASEEEKVSALVIGSAILQKHANAIMDAIWTYDDEEERFSQKTNLGLRKAMVQAIKEHVPQIHIQRILDLAEQGWKGLEFEAMDTDWQGEAYLTISGQNSNNSIRVPNSFMDAVKSGSDWNLYWRTEFDRAKAAETNLEQAEAKKAVAVQTVASVRADAETARARVSEVSSRLAEAMTTCEDEYKRFTVVELKDVLREKSLPVSGKKAELVTRLVESDYESQAEANLAEAREAQTQANLAEAQSVLVEAEEFVARCQAKTEVSACKTLDAGELWDKVAQTAWACADPGVQFDTTINEWHTCPEAGRINGSNPCSEYMFLDDTACNLASINLLHYYDLDTHEFEIEDFRHSVRLWTTTLEISVLMAQFPSESIAERSYEYRTLGLGYCNIGSLLTHMGIPYDDERAFAICGAITAIMCGESYATSAEMASILGPFPDYERNAGAMLRVMRNHRRAAYDAPAEEYEGITVLPMGINSKKCPKNLRDAARSCWDRVVREGEEHGFRNAQTTVVAPTGTIGLVMGADTTGIEPQFSMVQFKTLAGGGSLRIINQGLPSALSRLGYSESRAKEIEEYVVGTSRINPTIPMDRLSDAGISSELVKIVESKLPKVFHLRNAFAPDILGKDYCVENLNMSEEDFYVDEKGETKCKDEWFDTLASIGFSHDEIEAANKIIIGNGTIEGAPGLKEKHLPIFDCATPGSGKRSISPEGHVKMMAAAQPFISGAISKTINMPSDSTIDDVREAYNLSYETMNKACAVYREGSKLSQPLMGQLVDSTYLDEDASEEEKVVAKMVEETVKVLPIPEPVAQPVAESFVKKYLLERQYLPDNKKGLNMKARIGGQSVRLVTGEYSDGRLGEIFLITSKEGQAWRAMLSQLAIAVSLGLQYGVPLEAFVNVFARQKFEPAGMMTGGSDRIKMTSSISDWVFRELAIEYLDGDEWANVSEEDLNPYSISKPAATDKGVVRRKGEKVDVQLTLPAAVAPLEDAVARGMQVARNQGFTGDICEVCGGVQMVRNGTCLKCNECGSTTGCS